MADNLAGDEQVVRYVGGSHYSEDTDEVDGSAFDRKPKDDDGLSFTRRFFLSGDEIDDQNKIREIFASRIKIGSTAQFAQLKVLDVLCVLAEFDEVFEFVEDQLDAEGEGLANPAHALLLGLPFAGESVGSLKSEVAGDLLSQCVTYCFPARKLENSNA